jgi:hypothetical protein
VAGAAEEEEDDGGGGEKRGGGASPLPPLPSALARPPSLPIPVVALKISAALRSPAVCGSACRILRLVSPSRLAVSTKATPVGKDEERGGPAGQELP